MEEFTTLCRKVKYRENKNDEEKILGTELLLSRMEEMVRENV